MLRSFSRHRFRSVGCKSISGVKGKFLHVRMQKLHFMFDSERSYLTVSSELATNAFAESCASFTRLKDAVRLILAENWETHGNFRVISRCHPSHTPFMAPIVGYNNEMLCPVVVWSMVTA